MEKLKKYLKLGANHFPINDLPDDVLEEVLKKLSGDFLIKNAILVCKKWRNIIENEYFWVEKCINEKKLTDKIITYLHGNNIFDAKRLYFDNPFDRNLIKNPCGDDGFNFWCLDIQSSKIRANNMFLDLHQQIKKNPWDYYIKNCKHNRNNLEKCNWLIESENGGSQPIFDNNNTPLKKFTTSYTEGTKYQIIDLYSEGLTSQMIEILKPQIRISDSYSARFDCGSRYYITVRLLNKTFEQIDEFKFETSLPQWTDGDWHHVTHVFKNYSNDLRYIFFYHHGCDTQFWAGYYGIKITNSTVQLLVDEI